MCNISYAYDKPLNRHRSSIGMRSMGTCHLRLLQISKRLTASPRHPNMGPKFCPGQPQGSKKVADLGAQKWYPKLDPKLGPDLNPLIHLQLKQQNLGLISGTKKEPKMGPRIAQKSAKKCTETRQHASKLGAKSEAILSTDGWAPDPSLCPVTQARCTASR